MKPNFALNFTHTGIILLHRASSGWHSMGDVSLDDPDLTNALARLRSTATAIAASGLSTKLVIPNSQILYRTIPDPGHNKSKRKKTIEDALIGATPYALDDLVYDWNVCDAGLQLAVVARETLEEAEGFAREHRFNPLCFVAMPDEDTFDGEPFFGRSEAADALIGKGTNIDRDANAIQILATHHAPQITEPEPEPKNTSEPVDIDADPSVPSDQQDTSTEDTSDQNHAAGRVTPDTNIPTTVAPSDAKTAPSSSQAASAPIVPAPLQEIDATVVENPQTTPPNADTVPPAGFQSMRASFAATRSEDAQKDVAHRLSGVPSRVLSAVAPPQAPTSPKLRVTAKDIPDATDTRATNAPSAFDTTSPPHAGGATGVLRAEKSDIQTPVKPNKSAPLPEPPAMPAPAASARRVDTLPTTPAPKNQSLKIEGSKAPQDDTAPQKTNLDTDSVVRDVTEKSVKTATFRAKLAQGGATAFAILKARNAKKAAQAQASAQAKMRLDSTTVSANVLSQNDDAGPTPLSEDAAGLTAAPGTDAAKFNVFGARKNTQKRRAIPLGIILTVGLVLFLALVALWASWTTPSKVDTANTLAPADTTTIIEADVTSNSDDVSLAHSADEVEILDASDTEDLAFEPQLPSTDEPIDLAHITRNYVATGVWPLAPDAGSGASEDTTEDLYIASIDPQILSQDAVALPNAQPHQIDPLPQAAAGPAPAGTTYDFDTRGLVHATVDGAMTPSGVRVFAGTPPITPAVRPGTGTSTSEPTDLIDTEGEALRTLLAAFSPRLRPDGLVERNEQANLGGLTRAELGAFRPKARPQSEQQTAQSDAEAEGATAPPPTAPVVTASLMPEARPQNIEKLAAAARAAEAAAAAVTGKTGPTSNNAAAARVTASVPAPKLPKGPTATSVARAATVKNAINLRKVNLMGVYGSNSDRRALVRLPSGRLAKVKVGDRVDGGRVQSISSSSLIYIKGSRSITLKVGG
jgi:hypothetical protein